MIDLSGVNGWCNYGHYYKEIVDWIPNKGRIMEIGVFHGRSTCLMADLIRDSKKKVEFHCCDIFTTGFGYTGIDGSKEGDDYLNIFEGHLKRYELEKYVTIHKGKSWDVLGSFKDRYFDFIFIDADHNYEVVKEDIRLSLNKLKRGGRLAGHDVHLLDIPNALRDLGLKHTSAEVWEVIFSPHIPKLL